MPEFSREGRRLHYLDEGTGRPVLLLHAFPLSSEMFRPQIEALGPRFRIIAPDHRGFGRSDPGEGPTLMTDFAADALALMDHLGLDSAVVGGVSMGGYISMALLQLDPSRVQGLLLMDTQMSADDEPGRARREETARATEQRGMVVFEETLLPKLLAQPPDPALEEELRKMMRGNPPSSAASATRGMALRPDSRNILARFAGPALIVVGDKDVVTPPQKSQEMAQVLSSSRVVEVPGAGHLASFERPAEVNRELEAFLSA
jgi:pimeloyl-ACP methyl ester carboxylesterase